MSSTTSVFEIGFWVLTIIIGLAMISGGVLANVTNTLPASVQGVNSGVDMFLGLLNDGAAGVTEKVINIMTFVILPGFLLGTLIFGVMRGSPVEIFPPRVEKGIAVIVTLIILFNQWFVIVAAAVNSIGVAGLLLAGTYILLVYAFSGAMLADEERMEAKHSHSEKNAKIAEQEYQEEQRLWRRVQKVDEKIADLMQEAERINEGDEQRNIPFNLIAEASRMEKTAPGNFAEIEKVWNDIQSDHSSWPNRSWNSTAKELYNMMKKKYTIAQSMEGAIRGDTKEAKEDAAEESKKSKGGSFFSSL